MGDVAVSGVLATASGAGEEAVWTRGKGEKDGGAGSRGLLVCFRADTEDGLLRENQLRRGGWWNSS